jgi:hypothetical protein
MIMSFSYQNNILSKAKAWCTYTTIVVSIIILGLILLLHLPSIHIEKIKGEIPNEVYVWQRQWNSEVTQAISAASPSMSGFVVLAAEVVFRKDKIEDIISVPVNYQALLDTQKPVALTLRVGPFSGTFRENPEITELLGDIACSLIEEARKNEIEPSELQIDYDCAESKLADYQVLVQYLKEKVAQLQSDDLSGTIIAVPIVITVLPCWLNHNEFKALAHEANGFVLQVHSVEGPKGSDIPMKLCDSALSQKWVKKAACLGVPFRVALPTYGYIVGFNNGGRFLGLSAEGPSKNWPDGTILRTVSSDAAAMAKLVHIWQEDRPANMKGIIWYRLPVKSDKLNWRWETLELVMRGQKPDKGIELKVNYPESGLAQIVLANTGQVDYSPNFNIEIECGNSEILAADGMNGFVFNISDTSAANLKFKNENDLLRIRPGEHILVGWLRLNENSEVKGHVSEIH